MNDIISRAMRGEATPDELADLAEWRTASPENEDHYREMVALVRSLNEARPRAHARPPRGADIAERVRLRNERPSAQRSGASGTRWLIGGTAVAAAVVMAVSLRSADRQAIPNDRWQPAEIVTGAGELATVHLGDGSVARLAPRSRLRILPSVSERLVSLEGHAFFAVARQPDRSFRVRTRDGDAVALGTRFEVATNAGGLRLIVLDGRVALSDTAGGSRTEVGGGEMGSVVNGRLSRTGVLTDHAAAVAWMGRFLAFQSTPLSRVTAEIERMYGTRVIVQDSTLLSETVSASFTDEGLRQVVAVVCAVVGGRCVLSDSLITIDR